MGLSPISTPRPRQSTCSISEASHGEEQSARETGFRASGVRGSPAQLTNHQGQVSNNAQAHPTLQSVLPSLFPPTSLSSHGPTYNKLYSFNSNESPAPPPSSASSTPSSSPSSTQMHPVSSSVQCCCRLSYRATLIPSHSPPGRCNHLNGTTPPTSRSS